MYWRYIMNQLKMRNSCLLVIACLLLATTKINGQLRFSANSPKGRLLTPEEGCGYSKAQNTRVIGGTPAKVGAWPWMALLYYNEDSFINCKCGGSLITTRHILTAAHCVFDTLYFARLGDYDTRTSSDGPHQDIKISHAEPHKQYDGRLYLNDIAMLYLVRDVIFNNRISGSIRPVCLPIDEPILSERFVDKNPFLAGYGTMRENGTMSPVLMQVQLPVISNEKCKQSYKRTGLVVRDAQFDDRVVCAGFMEGGKDSCQGDSGGPLMLPIAGANGTFPFYQIGIVSWGLGCAQPNLPGINANVQFYADWIKKKLLLSFD